MPIDPTTLDSETPRTLDGREYPEHLRAYESYDSDLLALVNSLGRPTLNRLAMYVQDPRLRSVVSRWLASAEWRGLVRRHDEGMVGERSYSLTDRALTRLPQDS